MGRLRRRWCKPRKICVFVAFWLFLLLCSFFYRLPLWKKNFLQTYGHLSFMWSSKIRNLWLKLLKRTLFLSLLYLCCKFIKLFQKFITFRNGEKFGPNSLRVDYCDGKKEYSSQSTVFISNLPSLVSEDDLSEFFTMVTIPQLLPLSFNLILWWPLLFFGVTSNFIIC